MRLGDDLIEGRFLRRLNRFLVEIEISNEPVLAHLPNSGRLRELLTAGAPACLNPQKTPRSKTCFDLVMVEVDGIWVSCDARLPAVLLTDALDEGHLPEFSDYESWKREVRYGGSRFDLLLTGAKGGCLVECRSVTLVEDGVALFPDAPTSRGTRHVTELATAVRSEQNAAVAFVVQRSDALSFSPNKSADPEFYSACREAGDSGVNFFAYRCRTKYGEIELADSIPSFF